MSYVIAMSFVGLRGFLDFSKTFDVVNHSILVKLQMLDISGKLLSWISKFLFGRKKLRV